MYYRDLDYFKWATVNMAIAAAPGCAVTITNPDIAGTATVTGATMIKYGILSILALIITL